MRLTEVSMARREGVGNLGSQKMKSWTSPRSSEFTAMIYPRHVVSKKLAAMTVFIHCYLLHPLQR